MLTAPTVTAAAVNVADGKSSTPTVLGSCGAMAEDAGSGGSRIESARRTVARVVGSRFDGTTAGSAAIDRAGWCGPGAAVLAAGVGVLVLAGRARGEPWPGDPGEGGSEHDEEWLVTGRATGRAIGILAAACVLAVGQPGLALAEGENGEGTEDSSPAPYRTAEDAQPIEGTASSIDGPLLEPGTYTDALSPDEEKYYTIELDSTSDVYVSAIAAPERGSEVGGEDSLRVELASTGGDTCGQSEKRRFGIDGYPRPIGDYAVRPIDEDEPCQEAGSYLVKLTRESDSASAPVDWPVELRVMVEPPVKSGPTEAPDEDTFPTEPPPAPSGTAKEVTGGTGFNDAPALSEGVWKDQVRPGEVRYYRVPIEWGQQLFVAAEIGNHPNPDRRFSNGVRMELYNTARGYLGHEKTTYNGEQTKVGVATPPARYANRYSSDDDVSGMRFSGWYYLTVGLDPDAGEFVEDSVRFNLRLALTGQKVEGPQYTRDAVRAGFGLTDEDRTQAEQGLTQQQAAEQQGGDRTLLAVGGLGLGTALLLGLGLWTLLARRRAAGAPVDAAPPAPHGYGPPGGWR